MFALTLVKSHLSPNKQVFFLVRKWPVSTRDLPCSLLPNTRYATRGFHVAMIPSMDDMSCPHTYLTTFTYLTTYVGTCTHITHPTALGPLVPLVSRTHHKTAFHVSPGFGRVQSRK